jgi:hypothetical protein
MRYRRCFVDTIFAVFYREKNMILKKALQSNKSSFSALAIFLLLAFCTSAYAMDRDFDGDADQESANPSLSRTLRELSFAGQAQGVKKLLDSDSSVQNILVVCQELSDTNDRISALISFQKRMCSYFGEHPFPEDRNAFRTDQSYGYGFWLPESCRTRNLSRQYAHDGYFFEWLQVMMIESDSFDSKQAGKPFGELYQNALAQQEAIAQHCKAYLCAFWKPLLEKCAASEAPTSPDATLLASITNACNKSIRNSETEIVLQ